ncbi:MAG: hypothetical protein CL912_20995 [Deltaproteobacteria bacterium]|nr:hypothetical protein [Deltaproteobacteria bacterium]
MAGNYHPSEKEGHCEDRPIVSVDTAGNHTAPEAECMDIDTESWKLPNKTTSPHISSHLATTSPSGPSPGVPLPPISPPRTTHLQYQTLAYFLVRPFAQSHETSLALEPRAGSETINAQAVSPLQVKSPCIPKKRDHQSNDSCASFTKIEISEEAVLDEEICNENEAGKEKGKAIPGYLKAAIRKYPGRFNSIEAPHNKSDERHHKQKDAVTQKLKIEGEVDVSEGNVGEREGLVPHQAIYHLDTLLGSTPVKSPFDDYIGPQDPLFVGMASLPSQSPGQGISPAGNDDDDDDDGHHSASGASGAGGEPSNTTIKSKKKRVRKRKGKATGSGATTPSRQPADMPNMPPFPLVTSAPFGTTATGEDAEETSTPTAPEAREQDSSVDEQSTASEPSVPYKPSDSTEPTTADTPVTPPGQTEPSGSRYSDTIKPQDAEGASLAAATSSPPPFSLTPIPSSLPTLPSSPPQRTTAAFTQASESSASSPRSPLRPMPLPQPQSQSQSSELNPPRSPKQVKSPFVPAVPPEERLPIIKEGERAPAMFSHPQGIDVPRREYDGERVVRERADLINLVWRGDTREGGVNEGNGARDGGDITTTGDDAGTGVAVQRFGLVERVSDDDEEEQGLGDGNVERQSSWTVGDDNTHGAGAGVAPFVLPDAPHDAGSSGLGVRTSISGLAPRTDVSSGFRLYHPYFLGKVLDSGRVETAMRLEVVS